MVSAAGKKQNQNSAENVAWWVLHLPRMCKRPVSISRILLPSNKYKYDDDDDDDDRHLV